MSKVLPILVFGAFSAQCFFVAFNRRARRFMVWYSVWRYGNEEQKRIMETFTAVILALAGVALIVVCVYSLSNS
jgi:hypothetical protein